MKIAYCGYDFFSAALASLLEACSQAGEGARHEVYRVFTVPCDNCTDFNQTIYELCDQNQIPVSEERLDENSILQLQQQGCDLLITAAYNLKIPELAATRIKGINIHPTLLPIGRGVMPLPWTILKELKQSGVTVHKLTQQFDAGDILKQQSFSLSDKETLESLSVKLQLIAKELLVDVVHNFDQYWDNAKPQGSTASYWPRPDKAHYTLDWNKSVDELDLICRAFGKSGCYAHFDDKDWVVNGLNAWTQPHSYETGAVVHKTNTEMIIAAADGLVSLLYFRALS